MSPDARDLLARIDAFAIDGPDLPALPFAARLAREQGWDRAFAERAIREYKRFVFLAMTAGRPVCPSEQVDAVWHQHLTYTRSYWKRFCGETLGQPLHHDPTKGGGEEADKHLRMYADTLTAYREAFGHEPPADLWPPADERFGDDLRHVVVNTARHWVIPKARVWQAATAALLAVGTAAAVGCGGLNPFELKGVEFLGFFIPVLVVAAAVGLMMRYSMSGPKHDPDEPIPDLTWSQAALLAGGSGRVLDAAIARLIRSGAARVSSDEAWLEKSGPSDRLPPIERTVHAALPLNKTDRKALANLRTELDDRLKNDLEWLHVQELLIEPSRAFRIVALAAAPYILALVGFGGVRLIMGLANAKAVGFLVVTLIVSVVLGLAFFARRLRQTHKGADVLRRIQSHRTDLKTMTREQSGSDPGLAVALFGTAALVGAEYAVLKKWYPRETSGAGGCGSGCGATGGCGGGDGGGGGGGCGGCGGGGD